jgi:lipopolysaccharide assembly protein A
VKGQTRLIFALLFALLIAVFAVLNVNPVQVHYGFGTSEWPLVLVILTSVLMGGLVVAFVGGFRIFNLQREVKRLRKENMQLNEKINQIDNESEELEAKEAEQQEAVIEEVENKQQLDETRL